MELYISSHASISSFECLNKYTSFFSCKWAIIFLYILINSSLLVFSKHIILGITAMGFSPLILIFFTLFEGFLYIFCSFMSLFVITISLHRIKPSFLYGFRSLYPSISLVKISLALCKYFFIKYNTNCL